MKKITPPKIISYLDRETLLIHPPKDAKGNPEYHILHAEWHQGEKSKNPVLIIHTGVPERQIADSVPHAEIPANRAKTGQLISVRVRGSGKKGEEVKVYIIEEDES